MINDVNIGGLIEWNQDWWTLRAGYFDLSIVPNSENIDIGFKQLSGWSLELYMPLLSILNKWDMTGAYQKIR